MNSRVLFIIYWLSAVFLEQPLFTASLRAKHWNSELLQVTFLYKFLGTKFLIFYAYLDLFELGFYGKYEVLKYNNNNNIICW